MVLTPLERADKADELLKEAESILGRLNEILERERSEKKDQGE